MNLLKRAESDPKLHACLCMHLRESAHESLISPWKRRQCFQLVLCREQCCLNFENVWLALVPLLMATFQHQLLPGADLQLLCTCLTGNFCLFLVGEYKWELEQEPQDSTFHVQEVSPVADLEEHSAVALLPAAFRQKVKNRVSWNCGQVLGSVQTECVPRSRCSFVLFSFCQLHKGVQVVEHYWIYAACLG